MDSGLKYDWFWGAFHVEMTQLGRCFYYWIESTGEPKVMRRSTLRSLQNLAADVNVREEWDISRKLDYQMPEWCCLSINIKEYMI